MANIDSGSADNEMGRMKLSEIDPRLRASARLNSIRHVDKPLIRAVTRAVMRSLPTPKIPGVRIRVAHADAAGLRVYDA